MNAIPPQTPAAPAPMADDAEIETPDETAGTTAVSSPQTCASNTTRSAGRPALALPPKKSAAPHARQHTASRIPTIFSLCLDDTVMNLEVLLRMTTNARRYAIFTSRSRQNSPAAS